MVISVCERMKPSSGKDNSGKPHGTDPYWGEFSGLRLQSSNNFTRECSFSRSGALRDITAPKLRRTFCTQIHEVPVCNLPIESCLMNPWDVSMWTTTKQEVRCPQHCLSETLIFVSKWCFGKFPAHLEREGLATKCLMKSVDGTPLEHMRRYMKHHHVGRNRKNKVFLACLRGYTGPCNMGNFHSFPS